MRVLHINVVMHNGSTGALIDTINGYLNNNNIETLVAYAVGSRSDGGKKICYRYEQAIYKRLSMITGYRYGFAPISTFRIKRLISNYHPDIVHLHSINSNYVNIYKLLKYLKDHNIATVVTNHADYFYTGNCTSAMGCSRYINGCFECEHFKWATENSFWPRPHKSWEKMKDSFEHFSKLVVVNVSEYSKKCCIKSPILSSYKNEVILNGIGTNTFKQRYEIDIRQKYGIHAQKVGILVTSGFSTEKDHPKGGYWLLDLASRYSKDEFQFIVVGSEGKGVNAENIIFVGKIEDRKLLANIYTQCDIALGFSKAETFGMTCAEALCCGTPYAGFLCGGTESIAIDEFTRFVEVGNMLSMVDAIRDLVKMDKERRTSISEKARTKYSSEEMARRYYILYKELMMGD